MSEEPELRVDIDLNLLDEEWVHQPVQYHAWAKRVADLQLVFDQVKAASSVIYYEISNDVRTNPAAYSVAKITNDSVTAAIELQPERQKSVEALNKARHELNMAQAAIAALEQRKRALSLLVELWIRNYYQNREDGAPRSISEEGGDYDKRAVRMRGRDRKRREEGDIDDDVD